MQATDQVIEVWGELACFTRPEMKVERFSYPVMTPSAARAVYEAIYWKPQFRWQVTRIEVLSQPRYIALRRNEVKQGTKHRWPGLGTVLGWVAGEAEPEPLWADADNDDRGRTQRQTMALKGVKYRLHAVVQPWPEHADNLPAFEAQFRRRAQRGQCIYQPYLGCREFPAYFRLVEEDNKEPPVTLNMDLGLMLYDVFDLSRPGQCEDAPAISVFHGNVVAGVLNVPDYSNDAVLKGVGEEQRC